MSERTKKFSDELDELIQQGDFLTMALDYECSPDKFKSAYSEALDGNEERLKSLIKNLPSFKKDYQAWYSKAQAVIKQVLPDRLSDFISYFEPPKGRKDITYQNYMIRDYLQGLVVTRGWEKEVVVAGYAAIPEFAQQLNMLKAARGALESKLLDLKAVLQADLFDSEIETASALAKAGYLRAAGAICGVVIEKHLLHVCGVHGITVRKKNPGISDLSQLLRDADVTTVPQWRFIQHLADLRNICDHAKGREPTKEEINDLISGSEKVLKTVF
ncbi:hypothetical protein Q669_29665 [Labrenzia sp. C1B10]|uniref:hypothetical protein n=1 Tax=unclassified Labrenzia TaxID=2648686 RepID=UPI0003B8F877|nr:MULTISPECIES: hypothetical protein [unclassified Labrenzia]ERP95739.1 hypothetical protein Q669_29665 [Labrenzia sp. C1B10]ERS05805.1 hypothetical protein Q675_29230 [Labrenzia sp. C1B70]